MADKIKVGVTELLHASSMFSKAAQDCTDIKQNIETATEKLTDNWNGDSYKAFEKTYLILDRNMDTYTEILQEYSKALSDIAKAYQNQDGAIAKAMSKAIKQTSEAKQEEQQEEQLKEEERRTEYTKQQVDDTPTYSSYPAAPQYYQNQMKNNSYR